MEDRCYYCQIRFSDYNIIRKYISNDRFMYMRRVVVNDQPELHEVRECPHCKRNIKIVIGTRNPNEG